MSPTAESVTKLLNAAAAGDPASADELLNLIYQELHRLARARMRGAAPGSSLRPTELVHEAYLRLFRPAGEPDGAESGPAWNSRGHFFSAAAQAMRNILVDQARQKRRQKRGGGHRRLALEAVELPVYDAAADVLVVDEQLSRLERTNPRAARVVLLHCFSGLTIEEAASVMQVSLSTAEREWRFARALLCARLEDVEAGGGG